MSDRPDDVTRSLPPDATAPFDTTPTRAGDDAPPPELPPNYTLLGELGRGAMGLVYHARHVPLDREVALKLVLAGRHASSKERGRFVAEVQSAAAVDHPNVVRVYDSGEHAGTPYLAMELVSGGTLATKLDGKPLPTREAADLMAKVCDGVQAAHALGIVHRDLKPGNILIAADGTPKVADFGLAKRPGGSDLTHTGAILGTPGFMAPEQARGQAKLVGPPADVYSLGAVLFSALAGRPPFTGDDVVDVVVRAASEDPPSVTRFNPAVPRDLATICDKCLRRNPTERYATAGALADDLRRWLSGEPVLARRAAKSRRRVVVAVAVAMCGLLGAVVWLLVGPTGPTPTTRAIPRPETSSGTISGDPRDIAERYLNDAKLNPTNPAALKWTAPLFQFTWSTGIGAGAKDRPYYQYTDWSITAHKVLDDSTVEYKGTASVLNRMASLGGGHVLLRSGGKDDFTLTVRADKGVGAWRVDTFEFADRGSRAGPAELPADATREVIRETLGYPPEAFEKRTLGDYERLMGLQSWVFYHTGGPALFFLTLDETGQETIHPANLLASARPYTSGEQEGRVCFQIGRRLDKKDCATPIDSVGMQLNRNFGSGSGFPCLWYHWNGAEFKEVIGSADLSDGKEHELLALTAIEIDPPKGEKPRKVVLRLLVKKK